MSTITSANSVVALSVAGLFPVPQRIQGFSADRAWESGAIAMTETQMGVDGLKSSGYIFNPVPQTYSLQADSPSRSFFTAIINGMRAAREVLRIDGTIVLPATGESFTCTNGSLQDAPMLPGAGKVLQPMDYVIVWESIQPTLS